MLALSSRPCRRRVGAALIALAVWLVAVEVGPDLHLALHRHLAAHRHDGDATVVEDDATVIRVHLDAAPHRHGPDGEDIWDDPAADPLAPVAGAAARQLGPRPPHGGGSLVHRMASMAPPPPPVLTPFVAWREERATPPWCARIITAPTTPTAAARGPPA